MGVAVYGWMSEVEGCERVWYTCRSASILAGNMTIVTVYLAGWGMVAHGGGRVHWFHAPFASEIRTEAIRTLYPVSITNRIAAYNGTNLVAIVSSIKTIFFSFFYYNNFSYSMRILRTPRPGLGRSVGLPISRWSCAKRRGRNASKAFTIKPWDYKWIFFIAFVILWQCTKRTALLYMIFQLFFLDFSRVFSFVGRLFVVVVWYHCGAPYSLWPLELSPVTFLLFLLSWGVLFLIFVFFFFSSIFLHLHFLVCVDTTALRWHHIWLILFAINFFIFVFVFEWVYTIRGQKYWLK